MKKILILLIGITFIQCGGNSSQTYNPVHTYNNGITIDKSKFGGGSDLPKGATDLKYIDKYWIEFTLDSNRYLMHNSNRQCAITKIN